MVFGGLLVVQHSTTILNLVEVKAEYRLSQGEGILLYVVQRSCKGFRV